MKRWSGRLLLSGVSLLALLLSACAGATVQQSGAAMAEAAAVLGMLEIHAYDFGGFSPAVLRVAEPGRYTVNVVNEGTMDHQVTFGDGLTMNLRGRETRTADVDIPAEGLRFRCSQPGHGAAGLEGVISVGIVESEQNPATGAEQEQTGVEAQHPASTEILGELVFHSFEMGFEPTTLAVDEPGRYTVTLVNDGAIVHDITFPDGTTLTANAGETQSAEVDIPAGGLEFICSIPGHEQAGMVGTITVAGARTSDVGAETHTDDHGGPPPATDVAADPDAPAYTLFNAAVAAALEGTTHDIELVTIEKEMTVADGFVQKVWTFGGTVPGPVIRVKVGDTVRIHLKNPTDSAVPHSVDFHSSQVAWNDEMTSINPGEEKVYEWKADYAGVWMYHCGTAPALHHIANGMYGMVIVEPKEGLPAVDKEFALVQSEWYLGPQGDLTSLEKASAAAPAPDYVVFNGVANQYKDHPLEVATGERVRIFVLNAGPSVDSAFHVVGTIFDTVIKEGVQLTRDNVGGYGSQAVDLAPSQGAIVEFTTAEDGLYPIVTHAFNFVGRGALGLIQAGDGDPLK